MVTPVKGWPASGCTEMQSGKAEGPAEVTSPKSLALRRVARRVFGFVERVLVFSFLCFIFEMGLECVCVKRGKNC